MRFAKTKSRNGKRRDVINVGFAATIDCAIVIAAKELRLFEKYGVSVGLSREVGWATVREKLLHEELDAAATHASMLLSIYCGIGVVRRSCLTGMLLGLNGSAITLSNELWELGARDAATLGRVIREHKDARAFTFAVVQELSSQNFSLRKWLASGGVDADVDVRVVVIPSALVYETYLTGHLDGYCVAEPWNSAASLSRTGWVVAMTSEIEPRHPDKVLLVLQEFAEKREEEHVRMLAALIEAGQFCAEFANRPELVRLLAQPQYFDVDKRWLANSLIGPFDSGRSSRVVRDVMIYDAFETGSPTRATGKWVYDVVCKLNAKGANSALRPEIMGKIFRPDIFEKAAAMVRASASKNRPPAPSLPVFDNGVRANKQKNTAPANDCNPPGKKTANSHPAATLFKEFSVASLKSKPSETSATLCA